MIASGGPPEIPLYSATVALRSLTERVLVEPGREDRLVPGTRVLAGTEDTDRLVEDEARWLAHARVPRVSGLEELRTSALLDLHVLTAGLPAAVAGWSPQWRFAWPRDNAFIAVALAELGHLEGALAQLHFFEGIASPGQWLPARVDPWTRAVPDSRPPQFDGLAWLLWAASRLLDAGAEPERVAALAPLWSTLTDTVLGTLVAGVPPVSPDYWEVDESALTLGSAAATVAGLAGAAKVLQVSGDRARSELAAAAASALRSRIAADFAPDYPRHQAAADPCASIAFLAPPVADQATPFAGVASALAAAEVRMRRSAGGLAPGAGWRDDGISWTPETALVALAWAGLGEQGRARSLLTWLQAHRTAAGSLPEKVLYDGRPAAVAPLGWTAALCLLALRRLDQG
jgi:hypothetical protein